MLTRQIIEKVEMYKLLYGVGARINGEIVHIHKSFKLTQKNNRRIEVVLLAGNGY